MTKKLIVLDTETTGLEVDQGHRIVEVGAVTLEDRRRTDLHFHSYLNPQRSIDEEAEKVHGLSMERLSKEPEFSEIAESFLEFVEGSTLVIHNAPFDLGFLNAELKRASSNYPALEGIQLSNSPTTPLADQTGNSYRLILRDALDQLNYNSSKFRIRSLLNKINKHEI